MNSGTWAVSPEARFTAQRVAGVVYSNGDTSVVFDVGAATADGQTVVLSIDVFDAGAVIRLADRRVILVPYAALMAIVVVEAESN